MTTYAPVASQPYAWPFTGAWSMADTALFLIDFQAESVAEIVAEPVVAAVAPLLAAWRAAGGTVLHGRRGYDPAVGLPRVTALRNATRLLDRILPRGGDGWQIVEALAPFDGEPVIDHAGDNIFLGTDLGFLLQRQRIANLVIAGLRTEGAVHATMRAANDGGYECLLLEDGTATDLPGAKTAVLDITRFGTGLFGTTAPIAAIKL
ncbi:cysteine hydrolase [Mesorhizobium sp. BR1-1-16]|uniref:cysteine hydrolase family protein n=1 Tax=Mesorhizobium sp. BR1-1-16 TaxID=2876653 RepID=UPI001CCCC284|nr:isochorismatase family protein [Mesorhizobium sp. BR1-1-16]MBZ9939046.1 cysteine hydrolase [Mesorhizobium sp. BR1-1-16]